MAGYLESDNLPNNFPADIARFISTYKIPLILTAVGVIMLLITIIFQIKSNNQTGDVVFETASSSGKLKIAFDIEGSVEKPGLYQLDEGARVEDILILSGGFSANADRVWAEKSLNRAAKLIDGGKLYIPATGESTTSQSQVNYKTNVMGLSQKTINVNSSSQSELESLPGVGPATAAKIISGRPYMSLEELKIRKIIGNALYEKIKEMISI